METEANISYIAISSWSYAEGIGFLLLKTNYNKLNGLKQHKCILTVWRSEVPNGFCWAETKVLAEPVSSESSRE